MEKFVLRLDRAKKAIDEADYVLIGQVRDSPPLQESNILVKGLRNTSMIS